MRMKAWIAFISIKDMFLCLLKLEDQFIRGIEYNSRIQFLKKGKIICKSTYKLILDKFLNLELLKSLKNKGVRNLNNY